jgi:hypothetical protein
VARAVFPATAQETGTGPLLAEAAAWTAELVAPGGRGFLCAGGRLGTPGG